MSFALSLLAFVVFKVIPAVARVGVAVVVWLFTFIEAHHAAILATFSYLASFAFDAGSWGVSLARVVAAYLAASSVAGVTSFIRTASADASAVVVDVKTVVADEFARLDVAWHNLFPAPPAPPQPPSPAS